MDVGIRCKALLDQEVEETAWSHIDTLRQIRNHSIRDYYSASPGNRPSEYEQNNKLPDWKRTWPAFKEPSAHAAQQAIAQIHTDLENLRQRRKNGYKTGRLKWQGKGEFRSVSYNQSTRFNVDHNTGDDKYVRLYLEKIGWMRVRAHKPIPDAEDIKRVVLKRERTGEWFVSFTIEIPDNNLPEKPPVDALDRDDCIGIDLGILSYIHTSDNLSVGMLDLEAEYEAYAREQRKLSRKEHGSNNWEQQRRRVAAAKRRIRRKVLDYQHKLTSWLVKQYDMVAVEDLDVKSMLETSQNAKSKQDAAWHRFIQLLKYKGNRYGTHVVEVDPAGTTKECSQCGVETDKPIWVREHSCPACGHEEDRDLNAAKNVLQRGLDELGVDIGLGQSESTPVETALPASTPVAVDAKRVIETGTPRP